MLSATNRKRTTYACLLIAFAIAVLMLLTPTADAQVGGAGGQVGGAGGQVGGAGGQVGGAGGQVGGAGGQVGGAGGKVGSAGRKVGDVENDSETPVASTGPRPITFWDLATPSERAAMKQARSSRVSPESSQK